MGFTIIGLKRMGGSDLYIYIYIYISLVHYYTAWDMNMVLEISV